MQIVSVRMPPHTLPLTVTFTFLLLLTPSLWFSGMDGWFCFVFSSCWGGWLLLWFPVHRNCRKHASVWLGCLCLCVCVIVSVCVCFGTYHIILCISLFLRAPCSPHPVPVHQHTNIVRCTQVSNTIDAHTLRASSLARPAYRFLFGCQTSVVLFVSVSYALSLSLLLGWGWVCLFGEVCVWFRVQLAWPKSKRRRNRGNIEHVTAYVRASNNIALKWKESLYRLVTTWDR